jgi:hypothetical protein
MLTEVLRLKISPETVAKTCSRRWYHPRPRTFTQALSDRRCYQRPTRL